MTSQTGQQISTIHIMSNMLGSKVNQAMKFGQLREYNMKKIFGEKSSKRCGQEACLRPFYKNQY